MPLKRKTRKAKEYVFDPNKPTLSVLPDDILLIILDYCPKLAMANKRLYSLGSQFLLRSIKSPLPIQKDSTPFVGFDAKLPHHMTISKFARYMKEIANDSVKRQYVKEFSLPLKIDKREPQILPSIQKLSNLRNLILTDVNESDLARVRVKTLEDLTIGIRTDDDFSEILNHLSSSFPNLRRLQIHRHDYKLNINVISEFIDLILDHFEDKGIKNLKSVTLLNYFSSSSSSLAKDKLSVKNTFRLARILKCEDDSLFEVEDNSIKTEMLADIYGWENDSDFVLDKLNNLQY